MSTNSTATSATFAAAKPIWLEGKERERNLTVGFRAVMDVGAPTKAVVRIAASTVYRAFLNGAFLGYGPARGPKGWFRVDQWDLTDRLIPGKNVIAIEVAGYNIKSYYLLKQPSFLQAEIVRDGDAVAYTGSDDASTGFAARRLPERVQKVEKYSYQRVFAEVYKLGVDHDAWRRDPAVAFDSEPCSTLAEKGLLPRRISYPAFDVAYATRHASTCTMVKRTDAFTPAKSDQIATADLECLGFPESELEAVASAELQGYITTSVTPVDQPLPQNAKLDLVPGSCHIVDFGMNRIGFIGATVTCTAPTRLFLTFDEVCVQNGTWAVTKSETNPVFGLNETRIDGDVQVERMFCVNAVAYELPVGTFALESFEPYALRYLKPIVLGGACAIDNMYVREYITPDVTEPMLTSSDSRLDRLFAAGVKTFKDNTVDLFMDCPSRERGPWLCDSFFTARACKDLTGHTLYEKNQFENYLLPETFDEYLPDGMIPMCYPSDVFRKNGFIPNWALWFILQLEEYATRSGDRAMVDALRPRVEGIIDYFKPFKNSDGLLEKLDGWVFVDWYAGNSFGSDPDYPCVNYPTNMLFAATLDCVNRLYNVPELAIEAGAMRHTIRAQSFDGEFFVDNALRRNGKLEITQNRTEVCQYYAFYFDVASPQTHPQLWKTLTEHFGPQRESTKKYPEILPASAFIGFMLRFEILSRYGRPDLIPDDASGYFLHMADATGTLWEHATPIQSCDHGFASHIVHVFYRDILGIYNVDTIKKTVHVRLNALDMQSCQGVLPTPDGSISLEWHMDNDVIVYRLTTPDAYTVEIENLTGRKLTRQ